MHFNGIFGGSKDIDEKIVEVRLRSDLGKG